VRTVTFATESGNNSLLSNHLIQFGDLEIVTHLESWTAISRMKPYAARLLLLPPLLLIGACSALEQASNTGNGVQVHAVDRPQVATRITLIDKTIIEDLAGVVAQIYDPLSTTLQVNSSNADPLLQYFVSVLANNGFGIQRVSADQGANFVSYTRNETTADQRPQIAFSVEVGAVEIARQYKVPKRNVVDPISPFRLSGTRAPVTITDVASSKKIVSDPSLSKATYVAPMNLEEQTPIISLITPGLVEQVAAQNNGGPSLQALNSSKIEVNNLFYGDHSSFASILENHDKVYRQVIVFGNDSMVLGSTNKSLIDQFVDNEIQEGDVVSLIGCSNGPTSLEIGNEGLALGRAQRVTEALTSRGVPREKVLDEGCWAPVSAQDRFPNRGVVMELWRNNA